MNCDPFSCQSRELRVVHEDWPEDGSKQQNGKKAVPKQSPLVPSTMLSPTEPPRDFKVVESGNGVR